MHALGVSALSLGGTECRLLFGHDHVQALGQDGRLPRRAHERQVAPADTQVAQAEILHEAALDGPGERQAR